MVGLMLLHYWQYDKIKNQIFVTYSRDHKGYPILIIGMQNQKVKLS